MQTLLATTSRVLADDASARVRAHLATRLRGEGEAWIQEGLRHDDGATCPYCAQAIEHNELVRAYRDWFDDAYRRAATALDGQARTIRALTDWWSQVVQVGRANAGCFQAWTDLDLAPPQLGSRERQEEVTLLTVTLTTLLDAKRRQPLDPLDVDAATVRACEAAWSRLAAAVAAYDTAVVEYVRRIDVVLEAAPESVDDATRARDRLLACARRFDPATVEALDERDRLVAARREVVDEKEAAVDSLRTQTQARLRDFRQRINGLLGMFGVDLSLEDLETERAGGSTGARFTVAVLGARLDVRTARDEDRLERVLSDGDRSALALAVFAASLDGIDASTHTFVLDDPMTSLDAHRCASTADWIVRLAQRAHQVIVTSHHAAFLAQIERDWCRHTAPNHDLAELELDKGTRTVRAWSAREYHRTEHEARMRRMEKFLESPALDDQAAAMHGEVRKLLEGFVAFNFHYVYKDGPRTLEPVVRDLRSKPAIRESTWFEPHHVEELERLCAFGARGSHDDSTSTMERPTPEEVRVYVKRALQFVKTGRTTST